MDGMAIGQSSINQFLFVYSSITSIGEIQPEELNALTSKSSKKKAGNKTKKKMGCDSPKQ